MKNKVLAIAVAANAVIILVGYSLAFISLLVSMNSVAKVVLVMFNALFASALLISTTRLLIQATVTQHEVANGNE
jgi:hypothetical protein